MRHPAALLLLSAIPVAGTALLSGSSADPRHRLIVAPERRCTPYDRSDYRYPRSIQRRIVASMGGRVYGPYTGRYFRSMRETDIEHIVATSEAHDSGLCAAAPGERRRFASDLLNLTRSAPEINRCGAGGKCGHNAGEWRPPHNRCSFAGRVAAVERKYRLTVDTREAEALDRVLRRCASIRSEFTAPGGAGQGASVPPTPPPFLPVALPRYDDNGNGRIACAAARGHGIAPVRRGHFAHRFMHDRDRDDVVCE